MAFEDLPKKMPAYLIPPVPFNSKVTKITFIAPTALGTQAQENHFWELILQTPAPMWEVTVYQLTIQL